MASVRGIRGIRQVIPSGYTIGRQSPGATKGQPSLVPNPPPTMQAIVQGAGGKATSGGGSTGFGTVGVSGTTTVLAGTGISVTGSFPTFTVNLVVPVTVARGGTNATSASGTSLDNITGFSGTGYLKRTGAGAYSFITDGSSTQVLHGGGTFAAVSLTADVTGVLPVANGGASPAGQLPATATNDNAAAGKVGEFISASLASGSAITLTNNVQANVTSMSLTAGDWDINGAVGFLTAAATVLVAIGAAVSTVSATLPADVGLGAYAFTFLPTVANQEPNLPTGTMRLSLASTTTVYLVTIGTFSSGACTAFGYIRARRAR